MKYSKLLAVSAIATLVAAVSCAASDKGHDFTMSAGGADASGAGGAGGTTGKASSAAGLGGLGVGGSGSGGGSIQCQPCSADQTEVLNCDGTVKEKCPADQLCGQGVCMAPCAATAANKSSFGCEYYAADLDAIEGSFGGCFVSFIANTWATPVKIQAAFDGQAIDLAKHAAIPKGNGTAITYEPYDPAAGLPAGEVAILFLANDPVQHGTWRAPAACPVPAAVGLDAHVHFGPASINTGRAMAFHITTDLPVVGYQMLPYNAASAAATGATLLYPTSAWDTNYVAVMPYRSADFMGLPIPPSMSIVAMEDGTNVTILPKVDIKAGILVDGATANVAKTYSLKAGERVEFIQDGDLSGSPIKSDKPVGLFAGHLGLRIPFDKDWSDHAEQMIPPVRAMGSEYAVASYRDRVDGVVENRMHRVVGAVDGTILTYDPPQPGAPGKVDLGSAIEWNSDQPFVVKSQDKDHPFLVFTYMSGSGVLAESGAPAGYGDSDFVRVVPGLQYLNRYVFFTDPTYPETNLVVVRRRGKTGFQDVKLDCAGTLTGWQAIGKSADYEFTRVDLSRHNFEPQGNCNNGRHEMTSSESFGLWVWGWGSPETRPGKMEACALGEADNSCDVSYAYPAGENVIPINTIDIPVVPK